MGGTGSSTAANERKVYPNQSAPINNQIPSFNNDDRKRSVINEGGQEIETLPLNSKSLASLGLLIQII